MPTQTTFTLPSDLAPGTATCAGLFGWVCIDDGSGRAHQNNGNATLAANCFGTQLQMRLYGTGTVSVDGGSPVAINTGGNWVVTTIYTGLSNAFHSVVVVAGSLYIDCANAFLITSDTTPAMGYPAHYGPAYQFVAGAWQYQKGTGAEQLCDRATFALYSRLETAFPVDATSDSFPNILRAKYVASPIYFFADPSEIWLLCYTNGFTVSLECDGAIVATVTVPNSPAWTTVEIASGLDTSRSSTNID